MTKAAVQQGRFRRTETEADAAVLPVLYPEVPVAVLGSRPVSPLQEPLRRVHPNLTDRRGHEQARAREGDNSLQWNTGLGQRQAYRH
jgi:hypothetical protein